MEERDHEKLVMEHLNAWLDELHGRAERIVEAHWSAVRAVEQKMPGWENKSSLQLRCARDGNAIKLEWSKIVWTGSKAKGTRRSDKRYIRKGKTGYSMNTLLSLSKEWERPFVQDTERKLEAIRREWRCVTKAIQQVRLAKDMRRSAMAEDKNGDADA